MLSSPTHPALLNRPDATAGAFPLLRTNLLRVPVMVFSVVLIGGAFALLPPVYGVMALALVGAVLVMVFPQSGLWAAPAFVLVSSLAYPFAGGETIGPDVGPQAAWAVGLTIIASGLGLRLLLRPPKVCPGGQGRFLWMPLPVAAFGIISLASAIYGLLIGNGLSYVLRQFLGVFFLVAFVLFGARLVSTPQEIRAVISRLRLATLVCCVGYVAASLLLPGTLLAQAKGPLGFHAGCFALVCLAEFIFAKSLWHRLLFAALAVIFISPTVVAGGRAALGGALFAGAAAGVLMIRAKLLRYGLLAGLAVGLVVAFTVDIERLYYKVFPRLEFNQAIMPAQAATDDTWVARMRQLEAAWDVAREKPLFGDGFGSRLVWYFPALRSYQQTAYVDMGWAYILAKTGFVGTAVFVWMLVYFLLDWLRRPADAIHLALNAMVAYAVILTLAGTPFFTFSMTPWLGTVCGFLYVYRSLLERQRETVMRRSPSQPEPAKSRRQLVEQHETFHSGGGLRM